MTGLGLTAWIYLLDEKIKEQVDSNILQGTRKEILGGRIYLRNCHNKGMALGIGGKDKKNCQDISAAALGAAAGEYLRQSVQKKPALGRIGLGMVMGGGLSNYMDRREKGYVTDYISFRTNNKKLKRLVFNLSDFCILAGTGLWLVAGFLPSHKKRAGKIRKRKNNKKIEKNCVKQK